MDRGRECAMIGHTALHGGEFPMGQPQEHHSTSGDVAREVREFYERYPYPPPVDSLEKYRRLWQDGQRRPR
jgi:hypothetical protein